MSPANFDRFKPRLAAAGREHGWPLLLFAVLTLALTWPAARDFSTRLLSSGGDARNNMWQIWHVRAALLGRQPGFELPLLYYPAGVNLLRRGLGPVAGLLALPFWPWGPVAAHNGALLLGFGLSGYAMYLLARSLGFARPVALFCGLLLLAAPPHLAGARGHMTKTFLALLPLTLLALRHALDLGRGRRWALVTALLLLLTLFHNAYQFIFLALALPFFTAARLFQSAPADRPARVQRAAFTAAVVLALVGPAVVPFARLAFDPAIPIAARSESINNQPDLVELFLPPAYTRLWGTNSRRFLLARSGGYNIETQVYLTWTGLLLAGAALAWARRRAGPWLLFGGICVVLALGPSLKILGTRYLTGGFMPYALLTALPGLNFMRAPGRFMLVGAVALAAAAGFGLSALCRRRPRRANAIVLAAALLLLIEVWPRPWPQEALPPVPPFYQQLAGDDAVYGVFDLPVKPDAAAWHAQYAAYYQWYQMTHGKGIASGYLARTYVVHPLFPCVIPELRPPAGDVRVNDRPVDCAANMLFDLAFYDYRYVVYHKDAPDSAPWGEAQAARFLDSYFAGQAPLLDDELVTVYAVPPPDVAAAGLGPVVGLKDNWYAWEAGPAGGRRWARSPATLFVSTPRAVTTTLTLQPVIVYDPAAPDGQGGAGMLAVAVDGVPAADVALRAGQPAAVVLALPAGVHTISLTLAAGNFRPADYAGSDERWLSFAVAAIDLGYPPPAPP